MSRRRASPSPLQVDPSTTSRSAPASRSRRGSARERRLARPPDRDRQVVDDERRRDRGQVPAGLAAAGHVDRLGAGLRRVLPRQDAVRLDPGVEPRRAVRIGRLDDDRPRRVAPGQRLDRRRAALGESPAGGRRRPGSSRSSGPRRGGPARRRPGRQVLRGPDPGELALDLGDAVGPRRPAQDGLAELERRFGCLEARPSIVRPLRSGASAGRRGRAARRPPAGPTVPAS